MPKLDNLLHPIDKPIKPAELAERRILDAILDASYGPGDALPGERMLAKALGVTRPTLREALHRLAKDGWVTIAHGKPTRVNDFLSRGGLGVLTTLVRHGRNLPQDMVVFLLHARVMILPGVARQAGENNPRAILSYLDGPQPLDPASLARFDWGLQMLMVDLADNPVIRMMFNDFTPAYHLLGEQYFTSPGARKLSRAYYTRLKTALETGRGTIGTLVEKGMQDALDLWKGRK